MAIQGIKDFITNHWVAGVGAATFVGVASKVTSEVCKYLRSTSSQPWWNWSGAELSGPCEHVWTFLQKHPVIVIGSGVALVGAAFMVQQLAGHSEEERPVIVTEPNPPSFTPAVEQPVVEPHPPSLTPEVEQPVIGRPPRNLITPHMLSSRSPTNLRVLDLSGGKMDDEGVIGLAPALERNTVLRKLVLSSNHITSPGVKRLAEALQHHPSLQILSLACAMGNSYWARVKAINYQPLADMLTYNTVLRKLDLLQCHIDDHTMLAFNQALKSNSVLQEFYYSREGEYCTAFEPTMDLISWHLVNNRNLASNRRSLKQICGALVRDICGVARPDFLRPVPKPKRLDYRTIAH